MHGCFLSPGLTQCTNLPSQSSTKALLTNLLKCRFSNIIMHSTLLFTYEKKPNQPKTSSCSSLWRDRVWQQERKEGWKNQPCSMGQQEGGRSSSGAGEGFSKQPSQRKSRSFVSLIPWMLLLTVSPADFLIRSALELMSASASVEFSLGLEVKCRCLSAFLSCISRRADLRSFQVNRKVSTWP